MDITLLFPNLMVFAVPSITSLPDEPSGASVTVCPLIVHEISSCPVY